MDLTPEIDTENQQQIQEIEKNITNTNCLVPY